MSELDFQIPQEQVVGSGQEKAVVVVEQPKQTDDEMKQYLRDMRIIPMLNALLTELFIQRPVDPIDHLQKFIVFHKQFSASNDGSEIDLHPHSGEAAQYSHAFKLPILFEELLASLLENRPEDPASFALTFLRLNKSNFIDRCQPLGYAK